LFAGAGDVGIVTGDYFYHGTTNVWNFGADGQLTFPGSNLSIGNLFGTETILGTTGTLIGMVTQGASGSAALEWLEYGLGIGSGNAAAVIVNSPFASTGSVQIGTGPIGPSGATYNWTFGSTGTLTFPNSSTFAGNIIPDKDIAYDIGTPSNRVRHIYVGPGSITIGTATISLSASGGLVVPGLTRATGYHAGEVQDTHDQTYQFTPDSSVTVIDNIRYSILTGQYTASGSYVGASYSTRSDGEGYLGDIRVVSQGSGWDQTEADLVKQQMWAYVGSSGDPFASFVAGDWIQIPYVVSPQASGTSYEFQLGSGGSSTLAGLTDVAIDEPSEGQVLTWNDGTQHWENRNPAASSGGTALGWELTSGTSIVSIDSAGVLHLSTASVILGNGSDPNVYVETVSNGTTSTWTFGTDGILTLPSTTPVIKGSGTGTDVTIIAANSINTSTWIFSADGYLTMESLHLQGYLKGVDGSIGSTGQVLARQSNGGVAWANATGGYATTSTLVNGSYTVGLDSNGYLNLVNAADAAGALIQSTSPIRINSNNHFWNFGSDGKLLLPTGGYILSLGGLSVSNADGSHGATSGITIPNNGSGNASFYNSYGNIQLTSSGHNWTHNTDGSTYFPNYRFPSTHGSIGQVLVDDGSGILSWQNQSGAGGPGINAPVNILDYAPDTVNGTLWFNILDGRLYVHYDGQWVDANPPITPLPLTIAITTSTAPDNIDINKDGVLWFNTVDGRGYVTYDKQWVDFSPQAAQLVSTLNNNNNILELTTSGSVLLNGGPLGISTLSLGTDRSPTAYVSTGSFSVEIPKPLSAYDYWFLQFADLINQSDEVEGISVIYDSQGNIYSAGIAQSAPSLTKYDPNGNILWSKLLGGSAGPHFIQVIVDSSDNVYAITDIWDSPGNTAVVKISPNGSILNGLEISNSGYVQGIALDNDGNFYLVGNNQNDTYTILVKANFDGVIWDRRFAIGRETYDDNSINIDSASPPHIYTTGVSYDAGTEYHYCDLNKFSSVDGSLISQTSIRRTSYPNTSSGAASSTVDDLGNVYLLSWDSNGFFGPIVVAKFNSNLDLVWEVSIGSDILPHQIKYAADGYLYVTGADLNNILGAGLVIIKLNTDGGLIWANTFNNAVDRYQISFYYNNADLDIFGDKLVVSSTTANRLTTSSSFSPGQYNQITIQLPTDGSLASLTTATQYNGYVYYQASWLTTSTATLVVDASNIFETAGISDWNYSTSTVYTFDNNILDGGIRTPITTGTTVDLPTKWTFENTGTIVFPDGTRQSTAWTGTGGSSGAGATSTSTNLPPAHPNLGDTWYDTNSGIISQWTTDGTSSFWLDVDGPNVSNLVAIQGLPSRTTLSVTTTPLAANSSTIISLNGYRGYALYNAYTDQAAWVTIYGSTSSAAADSLRPISRDPDPGAGVMAEIVTVGTGTVFFSPATICYNSEIPATGGIPMKIVNYGTQTTAITVSITILQLES
jgi:hypothetical protein